MAKGNTGLAVAAAVVVLALLVLWQMPSGERPWEKPQVAWQPTTTPYDPECTDQCETVGYVTPGHRGPPVAVRINRKVDDPIVQWAGCMEDLKACIEEGADITACAEKAACPETCRKSFTDGLARATTQAEAADLLLAVFVNDGATCLPTEAGNE